MEQEFVKSLSDCPGYWLLLFNVFWGISAIVAASAIGAAYYYSQKK